PVRPRRNDERHRRQPCASRPVAGRRPDGRGRGGDVRRKRARDCSRWGRPGDREGERGGGGGGRPAESVHESAVDGDGRATETVSAGPLVWGRMATSRDGLRDATYLPITEESGQGAGKGAALLPAWLDATVDRQDAGTDERGHRVLSRPLPGARAG